MSLSLLPTYPSIQVSIIYFSVNKLINVHIEYIFTEIPYILLLHLLKHKFSYGFLNSSHSVKSLIVYPCQNSTDCSNILKMEKGKLKNSTKIEI